MAKKNSPKKKASPKKNPSAKKKGGSYAGSLVETKTRSAKKGAVNGQSLDPQRLAQLEAERDTLLTSIDDLEREHEAGDLDRVDYRELHDDYTARTAAVLREIEGNKKPEQKTSASETDPAKKLYRRALTALLIGCFAVASGLILARTVGERGVDDALSGSVDTSRRDQVIQCRRQGEDGDLAGALECYDDVIEVDPTNAGALTYRGWFRILQVDSLTEAGEETAAQQFLEAGQRDLNLAIEIDPDTPDAFAFRSVVHSRLGRSEQVCEDIASLVALDPPQFYLTQTSRLAETNNCETT